MDTIYNKITVNGKTLIDISSDTVDAEHLMQGYTAHDASGVQITGTATGGGSNAALIVDTTDSHGGTIREITTDTTVNLQGRKTVTPSATPQVVTADSGYDGMVQVEVEGVTGIANVYQNENGVLVLDSESSDWSRPLEWMPYAEGWDDEEFDGCYFVYDLKNVSNDYPEYYALDLQRDSGDIVVDGGYVNSSGAFTSVKTQTRTSNGTIDGWLPVWDGETSNERYYVLRVTPSGGHLTRVAFGYPTNNTLQEKVSGATTRSEMARLQSCIEIYGRLPYIVGIGGNFRCHSLIHAHLIDLSAITNLNTWFSDNYALEKIDGLNTWDTKNVTTMYYLFESTIIQDFHDVENWDVGKVTSLQRMFGNTNLKDIDLSNWTIGTTTTDMTGMFRMCTNLEKIILPKGNFSNTECTNMLEGCDSLHEVTFSGQTFNPKGVFAFFAGVKNLHKIDTSIWDLSNATSLRQGISNIMIETFDLSGKDTSNITSLETFAGGCSRLKKIDFTGCDFSSVTNTNQYLFQNCYNLLEIKGFVYPQSFIISYCALMNSTSLVEILTNLPTVQESKTITLGTEHIAKLTAEQIAIATEKGWTVA